MTAQEDVRVAVVDPRVDPARLSLADVDTSTKPGSLYTVGEVARVFFGLSAHWLRWRERQGLFVLGGGDPSCRHQRRLAESKRVGRHVVSQERTIDPDTNLCSLCGGRALGTRNRRDERLYTLSDVEQIAHVLAAAGHLDGERLRNTLVLLEIEARVWGYVPDDAQLMTSLPAHLQSGLHGAHVTVWGGSPPSIVTLCGSTRFYEQWQREAFRLTTEGCVVLAVAFYPDSVEHGEGVGITPAQKEDLDELHMRRVDLADRVHVLNVGDYIGASTKREIEYARARGKEITYLERPEHLYA